MPIYNDGLFEVFEIIEDDSVQANTSLQSKDISMTYQELGVSDRLRSDLDSHDIDIQLKIDDKLIFKDSLRSSSFFPTIICKKLRYGVHKIDVLSKKADINQKSKILLFPNQYIFVGFSGTDILTLKKKVFKEGNDSVDVSQKLLIKKMPGYRQPEFLIESKFNPFYTQ